MLDLSDSTLFLAVESLVSDAGRILLRVAAMLFLAYMLTMFLTLAIWSSRGGSERFRLSLVRERAVVAQVSRAS